MSFLKRLLREPLLHFILLGLAAFAAYNLVSEDQGSEPVDDDVITVGSSVRAGLRDEWQRQMGRAPSPEDEERLVEDWIDREVLYRRALEMGLDRADPVFRKRLVDQMRLILESGAAPGPLTDGDLTACLQETPERYQQPAAVTFEQVFLSAALRGAKVKEDAQVALARLEAGAGPGDVPSDPFIRGSRFRDHDRTALTRVFGPVFAAAVLEAPEGRWSGPLQSIHGLHLVRIEGRRDPRTSGVDEVRRRLEKDCAARRQTAALRAALDDLREEFEIQRTDQE